MSHYVEGTGLESKVYPQSLSVRLHSFRYSAQRRREGGRAELSSANFSNLAILTTVQSRRTHVLPREGGCLLEPLDGDRLVLHVRPVHLPEAALPDEERLVEAVGDGLQLPEGEEQRRLHALHRARGSKVGGGAGLLHGQRLVGTPQVQRAQHPRPHGTAPIVGACGR
jgi:hypothetical protein